MNEIEYMRERLKVDSDLLSVFNTVVDKMERRVDFQMKRAEDAEQSVRSLQARFQQQPPMSFKTEIGTKGK